MSRAGALVVAAVVTSGLVPARGVAQAPATVAGRVVDSATGAPIVGARLELGGLIATSGADGRFRLGSAPVGAWTLAAAAVGYRPAEHPIVLAPGERWEEELRLTGRSVTLPDIDVNAAPGRVLGHDDLVLRGTDLASALDGWEGVVMRRSGGNGPASPQIRGSAPEEVVVMVDGFVVNDPLSGRADLSRLSTRDVASVRVIPGAQSAGAGSGAIGGVIDIQSRPAGAGADATAWMGSHGSGGGTVSGAVAGARIFLRAELLPNAFPYTVPPNRGGGEGVRLNAGGTIGELSVRTTGERVSVQLRASGSRRDLPGPVGNETPNASAEDRVAFVGVTLTGRTTLSASAQYLRTAARDSAPPSGLPYASNTEGLSGTVEWSAGRSLSVVGWQGPATFTAGGRHDAYTGTLVRSGTQFTRAGVGAQAQLRPGGGGPWSVAPSVRLDAWSGQAPLPSGRLDVAWQEGATRVSAGVGSAVTAPPLADLFFRDGVGIAINPDLRPERVDWELELGLQQDWSLFGRPATASTHAFLGRVEDMILWSPGIGFVWSPRNYDVLRRGLDASIGLQPVRGGSLEVQGAWTPVTYDVPGGAQVMYRPRWAWGATASWAQARWGASARWRWVGERFPNAGGANPRPAYGVLDVGVERSVGSAQLRADLRDALDVRAEYIAGYPTPGRTLVLSLQVEWQ